MAKKSYLSAVRQAFTKIDDFYFSGARYSETNAGYTSFKNDSAKGEIAITLDTRKERMASIDDGIDGIREIAKALQKAGLKDIRIQNQYSDFDNPGKILDHHPNDGRLNDNKAKLTVVLPDTAETVQKLGSCYAGMVTGAAAAHLKRSIRDVKCQLAAFPPAERELQMQKIFRMAGIETVKSPKKAALPRRPGPSAR